MGAPSGGPVAGAESAPGGRARGPPLRRWERGHPARHDGTRGPRRVALIRDVALASSRHRSRQDGGVTFNLGHCPVPCLLDNDWNKI